MLFNDVSYVKTNFRGKYDQETDSIKRNIIISIDDLAMVKELEEECYPVRYAVGDDGDVEKAYLDISISDNFWWVTIFDETGDENRLITSLKEHYDIDKWGIIKADVQIIHDRSQFLLKFLRIKERRNSNDICKR